jgi:RNA polymerase sigma-70 factor, ECF subfamily
MKAPADPSDEALLAAARAGDRDALERLLERHAPKVLRFGKKMCRDDEDAREVLQDTLLAAARGVRSFRGASSVSTWLYTIARRFCVKLRQRELPPARVERADAVGSAAAKLVDPGRRPDEALAGREIQSVLEAAIRSLDPIYREVLLLRDVEGLTAPEVAEVLDIGIDAVKSRLHRARVAVRERVAPALGLEPPGPPSACPDVVTLLSEHFEGDVHPDVCRKMEAHVAACAQCASRCDSLRRVLAMCSAVEAPAIPGELAVSLRRAVKNAFPG